MYLSKEDIEKTPRIKRLNIINAVTGIKPANLIATKSRDGYPNVGIFSSVVHLGSDPALIGFVFRPQHETPRDTYLNIKETGYYTINQVPSKIIKKAHFTSAKFPKEQSEFERCALTEEYLFDFHAPFVKECPLKLGMEMVEEIPIPSNNTILMIGRILHISFPDEIMQDSGHLNLEMIDTSGISGVDSYYKIQLIDRFPYAHVEDVPDFKD